MQFYWREEGKNMRGKEAVYSDLNLAIFDCAIHTKSQTSKNVPSIYLIWIDRKLSSDLALWFRFGLALIVLYKLEQLRFINQTEKCCQQRRQQTERQILNPFHLWSFTYKSRGITIRRRRAQRPRREAEENSGTVVNNTVICARPKINSMFLS